MWEYNCSRKRAIQLVNKYKKQGKYLELCEIVSLKRTSLILANGGNKMLNNPMYPSYTGIIQ